METKEYTKEEMLQWKKNEIDAPIKQRWFKHKQKEIYKRQLDVFNELQFYEEVEE